jgi:hypothetical protein
MKRNLIVIDPQDAWTTDVRAYSPEADDALIKSGRVIESACGRVTVPVRARELPLDGAWVVIPEYEWGDQKALCYARYLAGVGRVQIVKAHGNDEDLCLDSIGNLWEYHWNPSADRWDRRLVE